MKNKILIVLQYNSPNKICQQFFKSLYFNLKISVFVCRTKVAFLSDFKIIKIGKKNQDYSSDFLYKSQTFQKLPELF